MREIKFRLWCKNKKEWEKDPWWIGCDNNLYCCIAGQLRDLRKENHILMQYAGLKDKNRKEIYEGDIVNITSQYETDEPIDRNSEVIFRDGNFTTKFHDLSVREKIVKGEGNWLMVVIGNIYENSELLENK